jgi:hypothetical protein
MVVLNAGERERYLLQCGYPLVPVDDQPAARHLPLRFQNQFRLGQNPPVALPLFFPHWLHSRSSM